MSRKALDQTLDFIKRVDAAPTAVAVCDLLLNETSEFGFRNLFAGTIPLPGSNKSQQESHVLLDRWPSEWAERYFSRGYLFNDPAIKGVLTGGSPFVWRDLEPTYRDNSDAAKVMNEAGDFGLAQGFTVPLITLEGHAAGFSFAGPRIELPESAKGMLMLLATYGLGRALKFYRFECAKNTGLDLSEREREALKWAAEGKSEWEIGVILNISEHTADKHLRTAKHKLGVTNRTHAIAEAIRRGIID